MMIVSGSWVCVENCMKLSTEAMNTHCLIHNDKQCIHVIRTWIQTVEGRGSETLAFTSDHVGEEFLSGV